EEFDRGANKTFGQNFIIDPSVVDKISDLAQVDRNTAVMEIGPGLGGLTEYLCYKAKKVISIEIDDHMIEILKKTVGHFENLEVIHQDFLQFDSTTWIAKQKAAGYSVAVCANLPYYITTPILFQLFESPVLPDSITVMMQKEVALRFSAKPSTKDYNALSVIVQYLFNVQLVLNVPKQVFLPMPKVDSAVIRFTPKNKHNIKNQDQFFKLIKACFKQRRKTLSNNLTEYLKDRNHAVEALNQSLIDPSRRAETCDLSDFIRLYEVLYENEGLRKN
ncbi:MAG: 16S rRNA (adenine(1518)-N(6)/adenine(1519)-N(6))-dimethyltransferase, partial [Firmicutes bacterium HGW-Firmicutes-20]